MKYLFLIAFLANPSLGWAQTITSAPNLCDSISTYQQADGVEFKPNAEDVVPADINPLSAAVPEIINIPITVELAERFPDLNIDPDLLLRPDVANLSIFQNGRVEYNGQDITNQALAACGEAPASDGQIPNAPLPSQSVEVKDGIEAEPLPDIIEGQYP